MELSTVFQLDFEKHLTAKNICWALGYTS